MNAPVNQFRRSVATLLLAAQGVAPISALAAPAVTPAAPRPAAPVRAAAAPAVARSPIVVQRALGLYQQARYDEAVTLLIGPVSRGELKGADLREARIVLARCYTKKGLTDRAADHFAAILAAEPAFMLDSSKADAEELAAFRELLPPSAASAPVASATPVGPQPAPAPPAPKAKTPAMRAALPPSSGPAKKGWLSSHKSVAALVAVAGGGAIAALAAGGGGGGATPTPPTPTVPDFPPPPPTP